MKSYYRVILGAGHSHAAECYRNSWIGGDWGFKNSLESQLPEKRKDFNREKVSFYLESHPDSSEVAAGLACGMLWTICKGIKTDDVVLCPDGEGNYWVGKVASNYLFEADYSLPHGRKVEWYSSNIARSEMSVGLRNSSGSIGTVSDVTKHSKEIEGFISGASSAQILKNNTDNEDPSVFALEEHLQSFLVRNWDNTLLGKEYEIFMEDGQPIGVEYQTDNGYIDILAISKDKMELLVIELKRGRASDRVVGQILNYMGYISAEVSESYQAVRGCIIALEDDQRIRNALRVVEGVDFYKYDLNFNLSKVDII